MLVWNWLPKQFGMADGSAYSRLLDAHAEVHDLVAREVTQNSWDAARRFRSELSELNGAVSLQEPAFRLSFDFREVTGKAKSSLLGALQIQELHNQLETQGHLTLRFEQGRTVLDSLDKKVPLSLLYINDYGATGLRGDPVGEGLASSDFFRAFGQIGGNDRVEGGGSFGFGKSAFIKASRIRCVIAYSSFLAQPNDPVTRRLWGFVYWPSFENKSGVGQLGVLNSDGGTISAPAVDTLADSVAEQFGFKVRSAKTPEDCGTSLLLVDHVLNEDDLLNSLERWWWPAIETYKTSFDVRVSTDTSVRRPQPLLNPEVKPYLRAFEIAQDPNAQLKDGEFKKEDGRSLRNLGVGGGEIAIVRDDSPLDPDEESDGTYAHVALIRNPRMVVTYAPFSGSSPSTRIKGVYVADPSADQYLRRSEPSTHDAWETRIDESYGPDWDRTRDVVQRVHERIRKFVRDVQRNLRPAPKRSAAQLSWANELLTSLFKEPAPSGKGSTGKAKKKRKKRTTSSYSSQPLGRERVPLGEGLIAVQEKWEIALLPDADQSVNSEIDIAVWVLADEREASAADRLEIASVTCPPGFARDAEGRVSGTLEPGETYEFSFVSAPYEQDWNVRSDVALKPQVAD